MQQRNPGDWSIVAELGCRCVTHQTRRTGRPYTLVLAKRETLFEREAARRKQWLKDLEWLKRALS